MSLQFQISVKNKEYVRSHNCYFLEDMTVKPYLLILQESQLYSKQKELVVCLNRERVVLLLEGHLKEL